MADHDEEILGKAYDARLMLRLLAYLRPYRREMVLATVAIIGHSALELAPPYLTRIVIDRHIPAGDVVGVLRIAGVYLFTLIAAFALEYGQTWLLQLTGQRIMFDLRTQIYRHLQRLDLAFYDRNPVGRLMTRVTTDVDALNDPFTVGVVSMFGNVFTLIWIMAVMIWMDWRLAAVAFSVLPLIWFVAHWFRTRVRESYRTVRTCIARINAYLNERIIGMATVQVFRRESRDHAQFVCIDAAHRDANLQSIGYYSVFYPAIELVSALAAALILWVGGGSVVQNTLSLGSLVAFLQYSARFFRPISDLSERFNVLQAAIASSERIFLLLDTQVGITSPATTAAGAHASATLSPSCTVLPTAGVIRFEHVSFSYVPGQPVLRDVSFEVQPGQRVALVGATGSGKTTIVGLLLRFYDVQEGRITIDDVDIRALPIETLRAHFGLVLQDVHLFSGSIAENVHLGNPGIDEGAVRRALEAVHATAFVSRLPHGVATEVAERGASLSVGQKQLLSFARALAFDRPVLILDEATSSVDTDTELLIRDAVSVVMRGRTTIAIAHRLSTIQDMDRILVLHKGELRESGTHQELLAQRGLYHRLNELQFRDRPQVASALGGAALSPSAS